VQNKIEKNRINFEFSDYVGFIKKVMKLLQNGYRGLDKIEVEMRQLGETEEVPERPRNYLTALEPPC
jgi:hypothetical protein